jgi:hypothetical protein
VPVNRATWRLAVPVLGGSVSRLNETVDGAASMIGQGEMYLKPCGKP